MSANFKTFLKKLFKVLLFWLGVALIFHADKIIGTFDITYDQWMIGCNILVFIGVSGVIYEVVD